MFAQVDEEPAIRTNTTILLGNIASYMNEGVCLVAPIIFLFFPWRLLILDYRHSHINPNAFQFAKAKILCYSANDV
jgi:hypothetical protein